MTYGTYHIHISFSYHMYLIFVIEQHCSCRPITLTHLIFCVGFFSPYSPVWAAARSSSAGVSSPGVPAPRGPPEPAAGAAGEPAERERGGSTEREREASRGERKRRAKGGGELLRRSEGTIWSLHYSVVFHSLSLRFRGCKDAVSSRRGSWGLWEENWRRLPWVWKRSLSPLSITASR